MAGMDNTDQSSSDCESVARTAHTKDDYLYKRSPTGLFIAINVFHKVKTCKMCHQMSNKASPLVTASPKDRYGGLRPWAKYVIDKKACNPDGVMEQVRNPSSRLCLICRNVGHGIGCRLSVFRCARPCLACLD